MANTTVPAELSSTATPLGRLMAIIDSQELPG